MLNAEEKEERVRRGGMRMWCCIRDGIKVGFGGRKRIFY